MKEIIDFIVLIVLYIFIFYKKWKAQGKDVLLVNTVMYVYLSFVLYFTLMPIITALPFILNHSYTPMNLVPFIDVLNSRGDFARQVIWVFIAFSKERKYHSAEGYFIYFFVKFDHRITSAFNQ